MKSREELEAENRALRETNQSLIELIQNAPAAIITLNPEGVVKMWNPAAEYIFGWSADEVVGKANPIVPEERRQEFVRRHSEVVEGDTLLGHEVQRKKKDGTPIHVNISTATVKDPRGAVERIIGVILDITERKKVEQQIRELNATLEEKVALRTEELREAIRDLESFSYSVSHDLRSPLRAIDGYANILLEDYEETLDEDGRHLLNTILKNTTRMSQLIDDLLAFSRTGRAPMQKVETDIAALVMEIFEELIETEPERTIQFDMARQVPNCRVDPSMFRQVLVNLLSNALKFTRHRNPSVIEFGAEQLDDNTVRYWVKDNGAGFDMAYADKLFGVFQRLHKATEFEGTGVGLAIVAKIMQRHGGAIEAHSEVDKGATFVLTLPLEPL